MIERANRLFNIRWREKNRKRHEK